MKGLNFYSCLLIGLLIAGFSTQSIAQTITTGTLSPAIVCPGGTLTVTYTTSGSFTSGNVFSAQLSDITGFFPANPATVGSVTSTTAGTITVTIPTSTADGSGYRIRIVSTKPSVTGTTSLQTLTVNVPSAPVATPPPPYCEGDNPSSLSATPSTGGTLNWYGTNASGGTPSSVAPKPTTTAPGNTYYVSQTVGGCESQRTPIPVTVNAKPAVPGTSPKPYCVNDTPIPLTATQTSGGTLVWYGTDATNGTASPSAPTPSTKTAGPTTYYVSQKVNGCESSRASLLVTVNAIPGLPKVSTPSPICQGGAAPALQATPDAGTTLRWYGTSASGGTFSTTPTVPDNQASNTYYVSQIANNCEGPKALISVTVNAAPAAPLVETVPPYCQNQTTKTLSATASTGGTLNWYGTAETGGTASATPTVPGNQNSSAYYVSQTVNGCESKRAFILVTVRPTPSTPSVVNPVKLCQNRPAAALVATPAFNGILNWYGTNQTGGTASATAPTPPTSATGTTVYYVSQSVNGCESARVSTNVTVYIIPVAPTATTPSPVCEGVSGQLLSASGQELLWYGTNATGGSGSSSPSIINTSAAAIGTTNYYVTQTVNGCESDRATIAVRVKPTPNAPATASVGFCQGSLPSSLSATLIAGATANWFDPSGNSLPSTPTPPTNSATTLIYTVSQTLEGCTGPKASLVVTIRPIPASPSVSNPVSLCQNRSATALVAAPSAGGTLNWYDTNQTGGTASAQSPVPPTTATGTTTYYVSQVVNSCESSRIGITVQVNAIPALPTATPPAAVCEGTSGQPLSATGVNLRWYGVSATGGTASSSPSIVNTSSGFVGTTNYYVTQTANSCESDRAAIPVRVKIKPNAPITSSIDFCQGTQPQPLTATLVANATPNWFDPSGTPLSSAPTPPNNSATSYNYTVSQTLEDCESQRATLNVRVKPLPGLPGVSPVSFCNNASSQQLTASGTSIKWYDASGNLLPGAPVPPTNAVGTQTYKVSQTSSENCEGPRADLVVTINALPNQPGVVNLSYCQAQPDQPIQNVGALTASGQNLRWYNPDGNMFPNAPTPTVDKAGTQNFQVTQTINNCESTRATVQVTINTVAAPTVAKSTVSYCINDKAVPLEATGEPGSTLRWVDPYGNMTTSAPTPPTINTNVKPDGDAYFVYQIGANSCYSPRSTIKVIVNATPTLSLLGSTSVNLGLKANLQLKFTGTAPFGYTITGGYTGTSRTTDTTIAVLPRGTTTYQVAAVSNGCGLGLPGNPATAIVTVQSPTVSTGTLTSTTLCSGASLVVPFTTTGQLNPGNTFAIELASVADTAKKYAIDATATGSPVTGTLPASIPGGAYYVRAKATNPEIGIVGSNSQTVLTVRSRPSATLTGTQTIYEGIPANLTVALGGEGPWTFAYADSLRADYPSITTTTSPYLLEVRPVRTTTYRITTVINNCGTGPISGTATVKVAVLLGVEDSPLDPFVTVYPVPTTSRLTVNVDISLTRTPATLSLSNLSGQPVLNQQIRSRQTELDLSTQPSGIYLLRVQIGDRQTIRRVLKL